MARPRPSATERGVELSRTAESVIVAADDGAKGSPMPPWESESDVFGRRRRRYRFARLRATAAEVMLIAGMIVAPALAACDLTVWISCRDLDQNACIATLSHAYVVWERGEFGPGSEDIGGR